MRLQKILAAAALMLLSLEFISCNSEPRQVSLKPVPSVNNVVKLDPTIIELSSNDAIILANLYTREHATKNSTSKQIEDVVSIEAPDGTTDIYAVNFNDGYLLISATKHYHPILADVEHGHYEKGAANVVLVGEFIETIDAIKRGEIPPVDSSEWRKYEELGSTLSKTKVPDDYYEMLEDYWGTWVAQGKNIYFLYEQPDDMPDAMYESFCSMAEDEDQSYYGYGYMDCSIITEEYHEVITQFGPLLTTHWDQGSPWNDSIPNNRPLGCATVAAGQIMRYHTHPSSFLWSSMPNSDSSSTALCNFLSELRYRLDVNNNGGTTIYKVRHGLEYYGYTCYVSNHAISNFYSELCDYRPVFMQGFDQASGKGHAWVCDGYRSIHSWIEYELFVVQMAYNQPVAMMSFDYADAQESSFTTFHMNLGYAGQHDGYYLNNNHFYVHRNDGTIRDYSNDRKDLTVEW